jgi:hypothetical protein
MDPKHTANELGAAAKDNIDHGVGIGSNVIFRDDWPSDVPSDFFDHS